MHLVLLNAFCIFKSLVLDYLRQNATKPYYDSYHLKQLFQNVIRFTLDLYIVFFNQVDHYLTNVCTSLWAFV